MNEMVITVSSAKKAPDYRKTASLILAACREFYRAPENEAAYMEQKGGQNDRDNYRVCAG